MKKRSLKAIKKTIKTLLVIGVVYISLLAISKGEAEERQRAINKYNATNGTNIWTYENYKRGDY